jgi:hypothetical protein
VFDARGVGKRILYLRALGFSQAVSNSFGRLPYYHLCWPVAYRMNCWGVVQVRAHHVFFAGGINFRNCTMVLLSISHVYVVWALSTRKWLNMYFGHVVK